MGSNIALIPNSPLYRSFVLSLPAFLMGGSIEIVYKQDGVDFDKRLQTVLALVKVIETHDTGLSRHCRKVTAIAEQLAIQFHCPAHEVQSITWAAMLHDIGKIGISDEIINKETPLTEPEWQIIRRHPEIGAEIVRVVSNMGDVASLILAHHERYDGKGYPNSLMMNEIPFGSRILAVADAFSAMTDDRPYQVNRGFKEALEEIERCSGSQFDPQIAEVFIMLNQ